LLIIALLSPAEHLHLPVVGLMVWQVDQSPLRKKKKETPLDAGLF
jgi:hypothetical protein